MSDGVLDTAHRLGVDPLVDVEGDRRHLERGVLGLAGPGQRGVEMRVVRVAMLGGVPVGGLGDQPDGRVVFRCWPLWSYCSMRRLPPTL